MIGAKNFRRWDKTWRRIFLFRHRVAGDKASRPRGLKIKTAGDAVMSSSSPAKKSPGRFCSPSFESSVHPASRRRTSRTRPCSGFCPPRKIRAQYLFRQACDCARVSAAQRASRAMPAAKTNCSHKRAVSGNSGTSPIILRPPIASRLKLLRDFFLVQFRQPVHEQWKFVIQLVQGARAPRGHFQIAGPLKPQCVTSSGPRSRNLATGTETSASAETPASKRSHGVSI